ncbi:hypothetical protein ASG60_02450 [Methylobacterium sp. Leaf469]|jgi:hypothetical protein|uniref:hypothetical protein n=1 Tax=unclassified Methylobacterium TaxID=2615210 RepID=UPI0006F8E07C|nr:MULTISPECIES: hypothetical protein [unclassified Methylobacterium]USU33569.1 hypothetical protein NG677_07855 [Methylobacterium sp. OTU13CASTA1]KQO69449.1 hypothetical protein ASF22_02245 [Methylobacterium sp. Leaf87]KQP34464.1 hypothetical protein ASF27_02665 [Methylobacterium sp. Leaf102]KQP36860.1 hypothetical protein ASF25_02670 [Methylobacterium sp. Leaf100]KQP72179.1 hypothetical protein ASF52_01190 [Methylobacterium sp. Leaf112]
MFAQAGGVTFREDLGVEETTETDNIVRWDGEKLYVEHDIYHNGQLVHRKYRKTVTEPVARALQAIINRAQQ